MKNTTSNSINEQLSSVLPGAMHYNFAFPWDGPGIHFVKGHGQFVFDADGNRYVDFFSKFGASFLGHRNERYTHYLAEKIKTSLTAVDHFGAYEHEIAKKILAAVPQAQQVRFSLSGTEAVQNALRAARAYTGKDKVVRFTGHYHGSADAILGGTANEPDYNPVELEGDPRGTKGRASHSFDATLLLPWNDWDTCASVLDARDDIAAFIMEPININGGGIDPDKEFLKKLKQASYEKDFLIIFDEIITGFRTQYGSAQERTGIEPDIWVFGKAISGGSVPVSCFMASNRIMSQYAVKQTTHGGTFNGYPLGLFAIDVTLDILSEPGVYEQLRQATRTLQEVLLEAATSHGVPLSIQGDLLAMNLHASPRPIRSLTGWTAEMKQKEAIIRDVFMRHGVIIAPPSRIYPTIALDNEVIAFVKTRSDQIFREIRSEYDEAGYGK